MNSKLLFVLTLGLSLLLSPVLSSTTLPASVFAADMQAQGTAPIANDMADCHSSHVSQHNATTTASHACCFNWVALGPRLDWLLTPAGHQAPIPFKTALRLLSREEGHFKPPKQTSASAYLI